MLTKSSNNDMISKDADISKLYLHGDCIALIENNHFDIINIATHQIKRFQEPSDDLCNELFSLISVGCEYEKLLYFDRFPELLNTAVELKNNHTALNKIMGLDNAYAWLGSNTLVTIFSCDLRRYVLEEG